MTGLLVAMLLQASACPAEQQPGWSSADGAGKRELLRACAAERKAGGEQIPETKAVEDLRPKPRPLPPGPFVAPRRLPVAMVSLGVSARDTAPQLDVQATALLPAGTVWLGTMIRASEEFLLTCAPSGSCDVPRSSVSLLGTLWLRSRFRQLEVDIGAALGFQFGVEAWGLVRTPEASAQLHLALGPVTFEVSETLLSGFFWSLVHRVGLGLQLEQLASARPGLSLGTGVMLQPGDGQVASTVTADVSTRILLDRWELRPLLRAEVALLAETGTGLALPWSAAGNRASFSAGAGVSAIRWWGDYGAGATALVSAYLWDGLRFPNASGQPDGAFGVAGGELTATPARWRIAGGAQELSLDVGVRFAPRDGPDWWTPVAHVAWSFHP